MDSVDLSECVILFLRQWMVRSWHGPILYWSFINTETGLPEKLTPADTDPYDLGEK